MNKIKKLLNGYYYLLLSLISSIGMALLKFNGSELYSLYFLAFFFLLFLFFKKSDYFKHDLRTTRYSVIISIILSLIMVIGQLTMVKEQSYDPSLVDIRIFHGISIVKLLICLLGSFIFFYYLFIYIFANLYKLNIYENKNKKFKSWKVFVFCFLIIIICYIPYFLRCFPGIMSPDSFVQIKSVELGLLKNNHPFFQTWFFGGTYFLGKILFGPGNMAIAFYISIQMIIIASCYSLLITYLYNKNIKKSILIAILIFFSLSPLHAFYSVTLWKDILFSVNFIFIIYSFKMLDEYGMCKKSILPLIVSLLILLFFRNNGIYVLFIIIPFLIIRFKDFRIYLSLILFSLVGFYYIVTGPVYNYIGVKQTTSVEAYSIPLQQIARVIYLNDDIEDDLKKEINLFLDVDQVKENYINYISDNTKNLVNKKYFNNNKSDFYKLYLKLFLKYPVTYIEAYLAQTLGYWHPDTIYFAVGAVNSSSDKYNAWDYKIDNKPITNDYINSKIDSTLSKTIPFSILVWSTGLYCVMLFISIAITLFNNNKKIYIYILHL